MDGDARLTREQIIEEAAVIRTALQNCSSPSERQRLRSRYQELDDLLKYAPPQILAASKAEAIQPVIQPADFTGMRQCTSCAEWVKTEAIKCRFCGADPRVSRGQMRWDSSLKAVDNFGNSLIRLGCSMFVVGFFILFMLGLLGGLL